MYVLKLTDDCDNITFTKCTDNEDNVDAFIPTLLLTIPCGLSFLCLISLMIWTILNPLITNNKWRNF